jgi:hypothetical protein
MVEEVSLSPLFSSVDKMERFTSSSPFIFIQPFILWKKMLLCKPPLDSEEDLSQTPSLLPEACVMMILWYVYCVIQESAKNLEIGANRYKSILYVARWNQFDE